MSDGAASLMAMFYGMKGAGGWNETRRSNLLDGGAHFYDTYPCSDGRWISIGSIEPQFYALLLEKLGLTEDPRFARQWDRERWPGLHQHFEELFATRTRAQWCALLENTDVCFGPVLSPEEAAGHPHLVARGVYFEAEGHLQAAPAPRFDGKAMAAGAIPRRGQHTGEIMAATNASHPGGIWKTG